MRPSFVSSLGGPVPRRDLVTGVTVGAVLVPQSLAYAELAEVPAVNGLYAALAALVVYALVGSSRFVSLGPTATSAILATAGAGALAGTGADQTTVLAAMALVAGGMALVAGLLRLGFVANLLSRPVLTGYVAGAAVTIMASQLIALFGLPHEARVATRALDALGDFFGAVDDTSLATLAVGAVSLAAMVLLRRLNPQLPELLLVVVGSMVVTAVFDLDAHGVAVVGQLPRGLPSVAWPDLAAGDFWSLAPAAAALALVGFAETVGQARTLGAASTDGGTRIDANRELTALGTANATSGLVGGFAVSASFSRSALNTRGGAGTRRADAVAALVVVAGLVAMPGLFRFLPKATLAAAVVMAVASLVPLHAFRRLARLQRDDFAYAVAAATGVVVLGVLPGLAVAVGLSIAGLLYRVTTGDTEVLGYVPEQDTWRRLDRNETAHPVAGVVVLRFGGALYFANANRLRHEVSETVAEAPAALRRVVIEGRGISYIDVTALDMIAELHAQLARSGIELVVAGLRGDALDVFLRSDLVSSHGAAGLVYATVRQAVGSEGDGEDGDGG